jgi:hypothetical protein
MAKRQRKRIRGKERPEKQSRRRLFTGLAALVGASGLLATVTGLVVTRSFDPIADRTADIIGSSPLVVYDDADDDLDALTGAAFAFDHALPAAALTGSTEPNAFTWDAAGLTRVPLKNLCPTDCRHQIVAGTSN